MFNVYIDVRGPHPVLISGLRTFVLEGALRSLTAVDAINELHTSGILADNDPLVDFARTAYIPKA